MTDARLQAEPEGLALEGPLTFASVAALDVRARVLTPGLPAQARVDLARVTRIDSAGVAFLVTLWRRARGQGGSLVFESIPGSLLPLLELYDLESIIVDSRAAAAAPAS